MRRYIFNVPEQQVVTCFVVAMDEPMAWRLLIAGECEYMHTKPGTTASGKPELIYAQDIDPTGSTQGEGSNGKQQT